MIWLTFYFLLQGSAAARGIYWRSASQRVIQPVPCPPPSCPFVSLFPSWPYYMTTVHKMYWNSLISPLNRTSFYSEYLYTDLKLTTFPYRNHYFWVQRRLKIYTSVHKASHAEKMKYLSWKNDTQSNSPGPPRHGLFRLKQTHSLSVWTLTLYTSCSLETEIPQQIFTLSLRHNYVSN